jgi:hypothetical protein
VRHRSPAGATDRRHAIEAPEVVSPHGLKPCALRCGAICSAHRNFKRPRKARRPARDPPGRNICGSKIVAAVPTRTAAPLPPGLVVRRHEKLTPWRH